MEEREVKARKSKINSKQIKNSLSQTFESTVTDAVVTIGFTMLDQLAEIGKNSLKQIIFGEDAQSTPITTNSTRQNYGKYWVRSLNSNPISKPQSMYNRDIYDYETLEFDTKASAEYVLNKLRYYISMKGYVTVGQYYQFAGLPYSNVDTRWGWCNLNGVVIQQNIMRKWILVMPKALEIEEG